MINDEMDFCRECGMEFPNGPEEVCPLCGNEIEIDENETLENVHWPTVGSPRCTDCRGEYNWDDVRFMHQWSNFARPSWLVLDEPKCFQCMLNAIGREYPDFEESGLEPWTFLIWKDGLEMGINLGPQLSEIDSCDAVYLLREKQLSREQIVHWLSWGCPVREVLAWVDVVKSPKTAMKWREAGFAPNEDTGDWVKWGCSPRTASKFIEQGISYPPGTNFKKLGVGLKDAIFLHSNEFDSEDADGGRYFIGTWLPSGLSPEHIVRLRDEIDKLEETFEELQGQIVSRQNDGVHRGDFWDYLPRQFEQLKALGLPITVENLQKFWGLSRDEILKVIDVGGPPGVAAGLTRRGASVGKLGVVERLLNQGVQQELAISLAARGFLVKHLKQIEAKGDVLSVLARLEEVLVWLEEDLTVEDAIPWLDVEGPTYQIRSWTKLGFASQDAVNWVQEGFKPEEAKLWRSSGVDSPVVAKRRLKAGIQPGPN